MDIYINGYGTYLHRKNEMFEMERDGKKTRISPKKVRSIVISTRAYFSTDVIKLALDNNIDIVLLDDFGNPYGRFWHSRFGSTAFIRRRQLEVFESSEGLNFVRRWLVNKISNSVKHITELGYKRKAKKKLIEEYIIKISIYIDKVNSVTGLINEQRNSLQGYEGNASKLYFQILSKLIPEPFKFHGRSSRPAEDEFNSMLNYGYGVLYGKVEKACVIAGLDPFVGIMHTDNYKKKSLVFDLIENYRDLANRTVFNLFSGKKVNKNYFDKIKNGLKLNEDGKKVFLENFIEVLNKPVLYDRRKITNLDIIQHDCHKIANELIGKI